MDCRRTSVSRMQRSSPNAMKSSVFPNRGGAEMISSRASRPRAGLGLARHLVEEAVKLPQSGEIDLVGVNPLDSDVVSVCAAKLHQQDGRCSAEDTIDAEVTGKQSTSSTRWARPHSGRVLGPSGR